MTTDDSKPNLPDTPPPPKVYPRLNRRLRIFMWLALLGGPLAIAMGVYEYDRTSRLKTEGVEVPGTLVDSSTLNTGKGRTSYHVTLDYTPTDGATTYRKEFFVSEALYDTARQAGQLPVTYLPSDPTVSAAGEDIPFQTEQFAIGGGLILAACGVWYYLRRQMQQVEDYITGAAGT